MKEWLLPELKLRINEQVHKVLQLNTQEKKAAILSWCESEVNSHIDAVDKIGWKHVREGDEYNPFKVGEYEIYTDSTETITVQLAVNANSTIMYIAGYIPAKGGWYEWEKYFTYTERLALKTDDVKSNKSARSSFYNALEKAKKRMENGNNASSITPAKKSVERVKSNLNNATDECGTFGLNIYSDEDTERNDCVAIKIKGIKKLKDIENKIIAIKTRKNILNSASLKLQISIVGVGTIPIIKEHNTDIGKRLVNAITEKIYLMVYDGENFVCCGNLNN